MSEHKTLFFDANEKQHIVENPDGTIDVTYGERSFQFDSQGNVRANLSNIRTIGVKNLVELAKYELVEEGDTITHSMVFKHGGTLRFSYHSDGRLIDFAGHALKLNISKEDDVMIEGESDTP